MKTRKLPSKSPIFHSGLVLETKNPYSLYSQGSQINAKQISIGIIEILLSDLIKLPNRRGVPRVHTTYLANFGIVQEEFILGYSWSSFYRFKRV